MSAREIQDQKVIAREMFVQQATHANADVSASPLPGDTICSIKSRHDSTLESKAEDRFYEPADTSLLPVTRVDARNLILVLRQLEVIAKRQAPRIAFKAKGRILFLDLAISEALCYQLVVELQPSLCVAQKVFSLINASTRTYSLAVRHSKPSYFTYGAHLAHNRWLAIDSTRRIHGPTSGN